MNVNVSRFSINNRKLFGEILIIFFLAACVPVISSVSNESQFFVTVDELNTKGAASIGEDIRVSGVVLGDTIEYSASSQELRFSVAHLPGTMQEVNAQGGLAEVLNEAVTDPSAAQIEIIFTGEPPELLRHKAQVILTGHLRDDGKFYANELLLKCPTRYAEASTDQP